MKKSKRGIPKKPEKNYMRKTTRLSYSEVNGLQESSPVLLGCEIVIVQIDPKEKTCRIIDSATKRIVFSFWKGLDVEDCKREARDRLVKNSASLMSEVRVRK